MWYLHGPSHSWFIYANVCEDGPKGREVFPWWRRWGLTARRQSPEGTCGADGRGPNAPPGPQALTLTALG